LVIVEKLYYDVRPTKYQINLIQSLIQFLKIHINIILIYSQCF
jgi:hypothetical protein